MLNKPPAVTVTLSVLTNPARTGGATTDNVKLTVAEMVRGTGS